MNKQEARPLTRARRRGLLILKRAHGTLDGWKLGIRQSPPRYSLHAVALTLALAAIVSGAGQLSQRSREVAPVRQVAGVQPVVPIQAPDPTPAPKAEQTGPAGEQPAKPLKYTVQPGDTLRDIAQRFDVSVQTIVWANQLENPDLLRPDQELVVLPTTGVLHTVAAGETLRQVAARYRVSLADLTRFNGIPDPDVIPQGTKLVVPGGTPLQQTAQAPVQVAQVAESEIVALANLSPLPPGSAGGESPAFGIVETVPVPKPTPKPMPKIVEYEVQPGDSINLLTRLFGVDTPTILSANNIPNADLISVGTKLRIPPVSGLEHEVTKGETLADIAALYQVDMGPIFDFNDLPNPDLVLIGTKLVVPGATKPKPTPVPLPAPVAGVPAGPARVAAAPAPRPAPAPAVPGRGAALVANAMEYRGYRYVWGGTSPAGFDCSGFVYYVYKISGVPIPRGLWGQLNAGPRISRDELSPGDIVFFENTYMPGLSHNGIYIGGGQFIHASDPSSGVTVSSLSSAYWASRYVGASRP